MEKEFNITGNCRPTKHYMADVSGKMKDVIKMVDKGKYFIINRPRQYGKTTTLYKIASILRDSNNYIVFNISFEGIDSVTSADAKSFSKIFVRFLAEEMENIHNIELGAFLRNAIDNVASIADLAELITPLAKKAGKKCVLLIDEVDKSSNNQLFLDFLSMLRNLFLKSETYPDATFHSVVLAGVHDVKTLKLKIRPDSEQQYNSPWNIATDFKVDMNLYPHEIKPMLDEYVQDRGVKMDTQHIADTLFYYTSGYPFLVSKLCKMLDEGDVPLENEKEWTAYDLEIAVQTLVKESNTNFESLIKNLENDPELYNMVHKIAIENEGVSFNVHNPLTTKGRLHGIIVEKMGKATIHNRIYNEVITNYMANKTELHQALRGANLGIGYKNDDGTLNMQAVMLGFQTFMKKEYAKKDRDFLEKNGRLVFLAFLKPIINGSGYDFKEPQISDEKRLDVVITHLKEKYIAELKLWYGEKAHEKGITQLADYLERQNMNEGYLLIFDHSEVKKWHSEWIETQGKRIFAIWV